MTASSLKASLLLAVVLVALPPADTRFAALADQAAPAPAPAVKIEWSAQDIAGKDVKVPAPDRPSVLLFALAGQPQSQQATTQAAAVLSAEPGSAAKKPQVVLLLTGEGAEAAAAKLAKQAGWSWPIVIDKDYAASGRSGVHVWPTTVIVSAGGEQLAHLPGFPPGYSEQLAIYLSFADGRIDRAELDRQLSARQVIGDSPEQMAGRHLQVAERLMAKGLLEQAHAELERGIQLRPADPALQLAMVRVLVLMGRADDALASLEKVDAAAVPGWQVALWRGRVLMAMDKWDQARAVLAGATRLNPDPAEAYYAIGLVYQHQGDWQRAAEAFRLAFESTPTGREAAPTSRPQ